MRYKFRAWDKQEKRWVHQAQFAIDSFGYVIVNNLKDLNHFVEHVGRYEPMQFTGLTDKNGKEIWEGDVVQCEHEQVHFMHPPTITKHQRVVEWKWKRCGFNLEMGGGEFQRLVGAWEVIGNVYENPELLKEGGE